MAARASTCCSRYNGERWKWRASQSTLKLSDSGGLGQPLTSVNQSEAFTLGTAAGVCGLLQLPSHDEWMNECPWCDICDTSQDIYTYVFRGPCGSLAPRASLIAIHFNRMLQFYDMVIYDLWFSCQGYVMRIVHSLFSEGFLQSEQPEHLHQPVVARQCLCTTRRQFELLAARGARELTRGGCCLQLKSAVPTN